MALLVADVDHYRRLAMEYGEVYARDVLHTILEIVRTNVREGEMVAHSGGDELIALLSAPAASARDVAERLCAAVRGHRFPETEQRASPRVTITVGVAAAPEHGDSFAALHAAADAARVFLKGQGRDGAALAPLSGDDPRTRPLDVNRLAGRADELRTLTQALEDALAGHPRAVAVLGEAGAGTAMLVRQLEPEVRLHGGSLVVGRLRQQRVREPYGAWAALVTALSRLPGAPRRRWRELHHLVPSLEGEGPHSEARSGSKYRLLEELAEYVRLSAAARPLVLLLDEMQWADAASWDVLDHVLQQLETQRVLLCLAFRNAPADAESAERRQALTRTPAFSELALSRLTRDEVKRWLEAALHHHEIGREFLAFLYRHTEGNPFFIAQLLRTLVDEGNLWPANGRWEWTPVSELRLPIGLPSLIARQLSRLPSSTQAVLGTAAIIGDEFDAGLVVAAGAGSDAAVQLALSEGLSANILRPTYERGGRGYAFAHSLVTEVLLQSLAPDRLRHLHQRVAEALERRDRGRASEIAQHYDAANASAPAYHHALAAAERAERVFAYAAATEFLQMAARNAGTPGELAEVRARSASLAELVGRFDEAEELCDLAIEWFDANRDKRRALTLRRLRERARKELGQPARLTLDSLLSLDGEAKALSLQGERVEILTMLSQTYGRLGDLTGAERTAAEAVGIAEATADAVLLGHALNRLAATVERDAPERAEAIYRRALAIFEQTGDARGQAGCYNNLGNLAATRDAWQEARQSYGTAIALARTAGMPDIWGSAAMNLGITYYRSGVFDRARDLLGEALALVAAVKSSELQLYSLHNMANLEYDSGSWDSGAELFEATASLAKRIGADDVEIGAIAGEGLCRFHAGQVEAAREAYARLRTHLERRQDWFQGREFVEALIVAVLVADDAVDEAVARFEVAVREAEGVFLYTAAWLTAACGRSLRLRAPAIVHLWVERFLPLAEEYGYEAIARHLNDLRAG